MFTHFMSYVEPIRDRKKIAQIKNLLRGENRFRDLLLFTVGINIALRISDLLRLKVNHFFDEQKRLRRRFWIREEKRGKRQEVVVNDSIREVLAEYLDAYPVVIVDPNHLVFFNTQTGDYHQPIKRGQAWKFITTICQSVGLRGNFGTHSLRKTWGYHDRMNGTDFFNRLHPLCDGKLRGAQEEEFEFVFDVEGESYTYQTKDAEQLAQFHTGESWLLEVNTFNSVVSVVPAE